MELDVLNNKGEKSGKVELKDELTATKASKSLLHEVVVAYRAGLRSGTHGVKTRSEVSGGGLKPWKQKGTGRARSGSSRSPLWRKGGIIFGPVERNYKQDLPKSKKRTAFKMAIAQLIKDNRFQVVDAIQLSEPKTKNVAAVYAKWNAPTRSLLVVDKIDEKFNRASRNIENVRVIDVESLNTYEILGARRLFVTKPAFDGIINRLQKTAPAEAN
jgi:large subunit ribosomal protein L4